MFSSEQLKEIILKNEIVSEEEFSGTEKNKVKNETIPIQLSSTGGFYKQMLYLANLESLSYYLNVKSLEISNSSFRNSAAISAEGVGGGESKSDVSIQLLADTYWQN